MKEDFPYIDELLVLKLRELYQLTPSLLEAPEAERLKLLGAIELIDRLDKIRRSQLGDTR